MLVVNVGVLWLVAKVSSGPNRLMRASMPSNLRQWFGSCSWLIVDSGRWKRLCIFLLHCTTYILDDSLSRRAALSRFTLHRTQLDPPAALLSPPQLAHPSHETEIARQQLRQTMDGESPDERDARTLSLWRKLDTQDEGSLDVKALKKGLRKLDHRELPCRCSLVNHRGSDAILISSKKRRRPD